MLSVDCQVHACGELCFVDTGIVKLEATDRGDRHASQEQPVDSLPVRALGEDHRGGGAGAFENVKSGPGDPAGPEFRHRCVSHRCARVCGVPQGDRPSGEGMATAARRNSRVVAEASPQNQESPSPRQSRTLQPRDDFPQSIDSASPFPPLCSFSISDAGDLRDAGNSYSSGQSPNARSDSSGSTPEAKAASHRAMCARSECTDPMTVDLPSPASAQRLPCIGRLILRFPCRCGRDPLSVVGCGRRSWGAGG